MIVVGDSTVKYFIEDDNYTVNSYPGLTLREYLETYNSFMDDEDIIVYSFGTNDHGNFEDEDTILHNFTLLKKGNLLTFIVVGPTFSHEFYDKCRNLPDNFEVIDTFMSSTDIHVSPELLRDLKNEITHRVNEKMKKDQF